MAAPPAARASGRDPILAQRLSRQRHEQPGKKVEAQRRDDRVAQRLRPELRRQRVRQAANGPAAKAQADQIVDEEKTQGAIEFLKSERIRLKSIEQELEHSSDQKETQTLAPSSTPVLHTRSRAQKSLFDFEEDSSDPWNPVLDGRDSTTNNHGPSS